MYNKKCSCSGSMVWLLLAVLAGAVIGYFVTTKFIMNSGCGMMSHPAAVQAPVAEVEESAETPA